MEETLWNRARRKIDLTPLAILAVLYGVLQWLPFGIFGWVQNEDGLMEWGSVVLLAIAAVTAFKLLRQRNQSLATQVGWALFLTICLLFIGEEISWGERLHGHGLEAIRSMNTQGETNLHNIRWFQQKGLLHLGWATFGMIMGLGSWIGKASPISPDRRLCLYFLIPAVWYLGFEFCRKEGSCPITVQNHQEIYEFIVAWGLLIHTRIWAQRKNLLPSSK